MYYAERTSNGVTVYDERNSPHMAISTGSDMVSYNLSGTVLVISYSSGRNEVYDVERNSRIR